MLVSKYINLFKSIYDCKISADGGKQAYVYLETNEKQDTIEVWFNERNIYYRIGTKEEDLHSGVIEYKRMLAETIKQVIAVILKRIEQYEKGIGIQKSGS